MSEICVIGSANMDMTASVNKFPDPGETLLGKDFDTFFGGKGANQAVAASRLGGEVSFLGKVGSDSFGDDIINNFHNEKIKTSALSEENEENTGVALIVVDSDGQNQIVVVPGANYSVRENYINKNEHEIRNSSVALAQLEIPISATLEASKISNENNTRFILDPAPAREIPDKLLEDIFLITPNQSETKELTGIKPYDESRAESAANFFHEKGVPNVVITLGESGAFLSTRAKSFVSQSPDVEAKDTTAAGDVFNGALAVGLCQECNWETALDFACGAAADSISREGAQASIPYIDDIDTCISQ